MAPIARVCFAGGQSGQWRVERIQAVTGEALPPVTHVAMLPSPEGTTKIDGSVWTLRGTAGHVRYVERSEKLALQSIQAGLGRPEATRAALIPIRKSGAWWDLAQDERRSIFEGVSHHTAVGLEYLPAVARRLFQSRELGEPFDFLTWFEYAPAHADRFEELVARLRATEEWRYVDREVDIRLSRVQDG
jgi:chlorite dismutase